MLYGDNALSTPETSLIPPAGIISVPILFASLNGKLLPETCACVIDGSKTTPFSSTNTSETDSPISAKATILLKSSVLEFLLVIQTSILVIFIGLLING